MTTPLGSEIGRLRAVEARLLFAIEVARSALAAAVAPSGVERAPRKEYCPRCEMLVRTIDDGETCAQCKLVL